MRLIISLLFCLFAFTATAETSNLMVTGRDAPSFKFSCGTSAAKIVHEDIPNWSEIKCGNLSATAVFLGDEDVDTTTSAAGRGWPICTDSSICLGNIHSVAAKNLYCVAGSTVVLSCSVVRR